MWGFRRMWKRRGLEITAKTHRSHRQVRAAGSGWAHCQEPGAGPAALEHPCTYSPNPAKLLPFYSAPSTSESTAHLHGEGCLILLTSLLIHHYSFFDQMKEAIQMTNSLPCTNSGQYVHCNLKQKSLLRQRLGDKTILMQQETASTTQSSHAPLSASCFFSPYFLLSFCLPKSTEEARRGQTEALSPSGCIYFSVPVQCKTGSLFAIQYGNI